MYYPTYRTSCELLGGYANDYKNWSAEKIGSVLMAGAQMPSQANKIDLIVSAEIIWVLDTDRLTYYLSRDVTEFLAKVNNKDVSIDLSDVDKIRVFSFTPHPSVKLLPCLVEISQYRMICHIQSNKIKGTESACMYQGDKFIWNEPFDGVGADVVASCTKIAWGIYMMLRAFPELVKDGYPTDMKERAIKHAKKPKAFRFDLPEQLRDKTGRLKPGTHLRHWHWRHLRDERYKRNPDGSIKVILISDMIVNRNTAKVI